MGALPLVASKLAAPITSRALLRRDRLHDVLDGALAVPLSVVVGAAGSGKSALVAAWTAEQRPDVGRVWINVDERDTPERLLRHVTTALTGIEEPGGHGRAREAVVAALRRGPTDPLVIVFDDLHRARSRQLVHELAALVDDAPPNVHLVLVTRADPCLGGPARAVRPPMVELRNEDLRLTDEEVAAIVAAHPGARLSGATLADLTTKVDGWAAGLQLALASLARSDDTARTVASFGATNPAVADHLVHEVLAQLPRASRDFMLDVAVLDTLDVDACRWLTERDDAAAMLADLARDNLLIEPYSDDSYRYHPLLRQLLRLRGEQADPVRARTLHERAARYALRHGDVTGAIAHLMDAEEHVRAVGLCLQHVDALTELGASALVLRWLDRIPDHFSTADDDQLDAARLALRAGDVAGALRRVEHCRARCPSGTDPRTDRRIAELRSHCHHRLGDPEAALTAAEDAARLAEGAAKTGAVDVPRAFGLLWAGRFDAALEFLPPDAPVSRRTVPDPVGLGLRARVELRAGQVDGSHSLVRRALGAADRLGLDPLHPARLHALTAEAEALVEGLAPAEATAQAVDRLLDLAELHGSRDHVVVALTLQARLRWSETCLESALGSLARGRALQRPRPLSPALHAALDALEARVLIEMGELARAELVAGRLGGFVRAHLRARWLAASGSVDAALEHLHRRAAVSAWAAHRAALVAARVLSDAGAPDAPVAMRALLDGPLADRDRRTYLEEGPAFLRCLRETHHPVAAIIAADVDRANGRGATTALSDRELAVLQFLPTRLTNQEIGEQLYVSLNTVKTHLKSLYRRLGVRSRDEAVQRARQLGLLAGDTTRPSSASALAGLVARLNEAGLERQQDEAQLGDPVDEGLDVVGHPRELSIAR